MFKSKVSSSAKRIQKKYRSSIIIATSFLTAFAFSVQMHGVTSFIASTSSRRSAFFSSAASLNIYHDLNFEREFPCIHFMNGRTFRNFCVTTSLKAGELTQESPESQNIDSREGNSFKDGKEDGNVTVSSPSMYRAEGLLAVHKPLTWTSQDVVAYIRGILIRDAKNRGAKVAKRSRKGKLKVGHGGTLDPLAEGVLVIGVGRGTKELQSYLSGAKKYRAGAKLGFETTTLDMDGNITKTAPFDGITEESIIEILPKLTGKIMQVPPIYSAIKRNGKKMYEEAREGKTAEEMNIEAREVQIYELGFISKNDKGEGFPCFGLDVECGGGTYVRSLIRDLGYELDTFATMTSLIRTQQGPFGLESALMKDYWNADNIYAAIMKNNEKIGILKD